MDLKEIESKYRTELLPRCEAFTVRLHGLVEELLAGAGIPYVQIEHRAKSVESLLSKIGSRSYGDPLNEITDLAGVRIITYYHDDVARVAELVRKELKVDRKSSIDMNKQLGVDEFGYRSWHLVASLKHPRSRLSEWRSLADLKVEIQIRSVLQHAWAAISHQLDYKSAAQAPIEIRRQLFRLSALLELADEEFLSLRDKTETIQSRYRSDVERGELNIPLNKDSLAEFLQEAVNLEHWYDVGIEAGMEPEVDWRQSVGDPIAQTRFLGTLHAVGIDTLEELQALIQRLDRLAKERLSAFVQCVKKHGGKFYAVPIDILEVLVSLARAEVLPKDYDWDDYYRDPIQAALQELCGMKRPSKRRSTKKPRRT